MTSLQEIRDFMRPQKLAIAGASRDPKKFGGAILAELKKKGYELFPVHPVASEIDGITCYHSVGSLPGGVDHLLIATRKDHTAGLVQEAARHGIKKIWIQQHSDTPEALQIAKNENITVISGRCIFMFADPVAGVHSFHRWLSRLVGSYPK